jgi:hypothetical protein
MPIPVASYFEYHSLQKWYYLMIKNIMIKGTGLFIIWKELLVLLGMMGVLFVVAIKKFKIRLE